MSGGLAKHRSFLISCVEKHCKTFDNFQLELIVEICYNLFQNPKVLLSTSDLKLFKKSLSLLSDIAQSRDYALTDKLVRTLSQNQLACLANIALNYLK